MSNEIEQLPRLLARAVATLEKATTAAEILEAHGAARLAYSAGKAAERLAKMKHAHDDIITAIHKTQADALMIEARAQCRLADEYDAAQERGEVKGHGRKRSDIPKENITSSVTDIGLTSKLVHEARKVRDAEKANPGMVRKTLDAQVENGKEPTRADVKRAIKGKESNPRRRRKSTRQTDAVRDDILARAERGVSSNQIAAEVGVEGRAVRHVLEREQIRQEIGPIDWATIPATAKEKIEAAIRQHRQKLDVEFRQAVLDEVKQRIDEIVLPSWKKRIDEAQRLYRHRRGAMDKLTFNKIRRALHPDSRHSISDKVLAEAFDTFMSLEKFLLDEKDSPTEIGDLPASLEEWEKAKRQATAGRRAKRSGGNAIRPR